VIPMLGASDQVSGQNLMRRLPQRMRVPARVQLLRPQQRPPHPRQQKREFLHPRWHSRSRFPLSPRPLSPRARLPLSSRPLSLCLRPRSRLRLSPRPRPRFRLLFQQRARA
jgi:hypothetical protein